MSTKDLNALCAEFQTTDRKRRPNYGNPDGFEPCPFCGACPHIRVEDDEGNCHDYDPDYEKNPWSGLWYVVEHTRDFSPRRGGALKNTGDIPWNKDCLIATEGFQWWGFGSVPHIGGDKAVFRTRKAAVKWWNKNVAKAGRAEKPAETLRRIKAVSGESVESVKASKAFDAAWKCASICCYKAVLRKAGSCENCAYRIQIGGENACARLGARLDALDGVCRYWSGSPGSTRRTEPDADVIARLMLERNKGELP